MEICFDFGIRIITFRFAWANLWCNNLGLGIFLRSGILLGYKEQFWYLEVSHSLLYMYTVFFLHYIQYFSILVHEKATILTCYHYIINMTACVRSHVACVCVCVLRGVACYRLVVCEIAFCTTRPSQKSRKWVIIIIYNRTSIALKSSGTQAQKRNKTKSLIIFKSRGDTGVIISLRGHSLLKGEKQFWKDTPHSS